MLSVACVLVYLLTCQWQWQLRQTCQYIFGFFVYLPTSKHVPFSIHRCICVRISKYLVHFLLFSQCRDLQMFTRSMSLWMCVCLLCLCVLFFFFCIFIIFFLLYLLLLLVYSVNVIVVIVMKCFRKWTKFSTKQTQQVLKQHKNVE